MGTCGAKKGGFNDPKFEGYYENDEIKSKV